MTVSLHHLPDHIFYHMYKQLEIHDILALRNTCKAMRTKIASLLQDNVIKMLKPFFHNPTAMIDAMRVTRSVISGSFALACFSPTRNWRPHDLDMYVSMSHVHMLLEALVAFGNYIVMWGKPWIVNPQYRTSNIMEIISLSNGERKIDVIVSNSCALLPIFAFHSTIVMNFVSAYGLYCGYPSLTLNRTGIIHPHLYRHRHTLRRSETNALTKYMNRQYLLTQEQSHDNCANHIKCTATIRSLSDQHSLWLPFLHSTHLSGQDIFKHEIVMWSLGGGPCKDRVKSSFAFVSAHASKNCALPFFICSVTPPDVHTCSS
jgi:hypothetical protein